jgi:hypothetical protein
MIGGMAAHPRTTRLLVVALAVCLGAAAAWAGERELYGKPLRGLSTTPLADLVRSPESWEGKTVRTGGTVSASPAPGAEGFTLEARGASLRVVFRDRAVRVPANAAGADAAVEGTFHASPPQLEASGAELSRASHR